MLLRNLTKICISKAELINKHGEYDIKWKYKGKKITLEEINKLKIKEVNEIKLALIIENNEYGTAYFSLQQDVNELDRKSTGEVDYSIYKGRTQQKYDIEKGDGISLSDISKESEIKPEYRVIDINQIGNTYLYILEKYNGN